MCITPVEEMRLTVKTKKNVHHIPQKWQPCNRKGVLGKGSVTDAKDASAQAVGGACVSADSHLDPRALSCPLQRHSLQGLLASISNRKPTLEEATSAVATFLSH